MSGNRLCVGFRFFHEDFIPQLLFVSLIKERKYPGIRKSCLSFSECFPMYRSFGI